MDANYSCGSSFVGRPSRIVKLGALPAGAYHCPRPVSAYLACFLVDIWSVTGHVTASKPRACRRVHSVSYAVGVLIRGTTWADSRVWAPPNLCHDVCQ